MTAYVCATRRDKDGDLAGGCGFLWTPDGDLRKKVPDRARWRLCPDHEDDPQYTTKKEKK